MNTCRTCGHPAEAHDRAGCEFNEIRTECDCTEFSLDWLDVKEAVDRQNQWMKESLHRQNKRMVDALSRGRWGNDWEASDIRRELRRLDRTKKNKWFK